MSRGESYGGGQSSLGYLFGSEEQPSQPPPTKTAPLPPYGIDVATTEKFAGAAAAPSTNQNVPNASAYPRAQGQHYGTFITADRPSTKVKSVPGGDSSLGYLFGDK
ncbi:hypothetical protein L6164_019429 [Bauhinia variegata]|uniref:Uncharacterized protein n=1 Tax=Bauhinia variegata TaxID=167791 RepID=A0ACB9MS08_BAUVA|nr:hypothetical protein L6164_019429 [Bauhinia variegata]